MLRKKWWLLLLASVFIFVIAGCSSDSASEDDQVNEGGESNTEEGADETNELVDITDEEITLSYASWANHELNQYLADKFMEKYPNITVELVQLEQEGWNDHLTNLASTGELPDVFWYLGNVDIAIRNAWLGDMTEYFEADPENENLLDTIKDAGYFDGERKLAAPANYYPYTVFLDENVFEQLNVEMPSPDWTYSEMIDLMQQMTVPEQGIFGYNTFTKLVTIAPIVNPDGYGEFGWDGESYDLTADWADAAMQHAEFVRSGVHAPFFDTDEAEAAFGDRELWVANTGRLAMQLDAWWTVGLFAEPEFVDKGIKWVPYVVPKGDNASTENKPAFIDFGAISSATEHPREAYELLKFFGWGSEGWEHKLTAFETLQDENGQLIFQHPDGLPLVKDQEIWDGLRALLPESHYYDDFLARAKHPIPLGGAAQPGFQTFLDEVYFGGEYGDVESATANGEVNAHDIAQDLTEKANQYREEAIQELFY
ncbi:multiple sugar transport system substrate-binding protein [Gracilibacillus halotolerans]|uniref:Multiple sugar transport system substrate-binding protein n=1 Tax=Gracilibacillus halotolerans TaxID=74386 RepID=A0A841RKI1_9BACI|nr:extracellular solute-binding protein [Gracilibacillus halotolerans]MBB6511705.1 multiple sugar transport system substrate-binding protein [Gracilibacillus halotolerans]